MSEVTASLVKELRDKTGAGMMDCKNALVETNGNIEESIDWLRKKGISGAEKKSARVAADGVIAVSINTDAAALVEINSETDFVSRNPDFQKFAKIISEIALINGQTIEELKKAKYLDSGKSVEEALEKLVYTAKSNKNLMPKIINCVEKNCTLGEIIFALKNVFGEYLE